MLISLITLKAEKREKANETDSSNTVITSRDIKKLIAQGIKEHQEAMSPLVLGYRNPYPSHYDSVSFPRGYQKLNFEKFDRTNGSSHEHLAHFYSACSETAMNDALLIRQFV